VQEARAEFIKTHLSSSHRIDRLRRARRSPNNATHIAPAPRHEHSDPTPIMQRRSLGRSYELSPTPAIPNGDQSSNLLFHAEPGHVRSGVPAWLEFREAV